MAITATNLIMGPATMYSGDYGAAEPSDSSVNSTPSASAWTDLGATMGGVEQEVKQDYTNLEADQTVDPVGARLTARLCVVKFKLAEPTLENLQLVLNGGTAASGSGYKTFSPNIGVAATQPTYKALLFDGFSAGSLARRVIVRKVLSTAGVKFAYKKDEQTVYDVEFTAFFVSTSIEPFKIIDEDD